MGRVRFQVLYEDNHLLVVNKPAELPTMGVAEGVPSLLSEAKSYLKEKYQKPGNVYLGIVSRLDAPVTGVVVMARTSKAASRLSEQFRTRSVDKCYWAVVEGIVQPLEGELHDWLRKDERHRRMHITGASVPDAKEARLRYVVQQKIDRRTLVEIQLLTGRKHQIRVQMEHQGWPIWGDRKYGAKQRFSSGIALHSRSIEFQHPVRKVPIKLLAPLPLAWRGLGISGLRC